MAEVKHCVYVITNDQTSKVYFGITNDPIVRFRAHKSASTNPKNKDYQSKLSRAIRKYGNKSFGLKVIAYGTREYCGYMEVKFIAEFDSMKKGYNQSFGGEGSIFIQGPNKGKKCPRPPDKLTASQKKRLIVEARAGINPKDMKWLPISTGHARYILTSEGVRYVGKRDTVTSEQIQRLLYEHGTGIKVSEMKWWPHSRQVARYYIVKYNE